MIQYKTIKSYSFPIVLIFSIVAGGFTGYFFGPHVQHLKPFGDIFLNLIFTAIVPLVFFSVSSAIVRASSAKKLGKIISSMVAVFIFTGIIASLITIVAITIFPPTQNIILQLAMPEQYVNINFIGKVASIFTVSDFSKLLEHENMLALIIFSMLVGLAVSTTDSKGRALSALLEAGEAMSMRLFSLIMYYAPIGFFAYFAVLVNELGPKLIENYFRITIIYYTLSCLYFFCAFTAYAYLSGRMAGVKLFWKNIFLPMITSLATCSGAASIPANLVATEKMRVPAEIRETVVPLGAIIHKDGSVMGGIIKIAFLFGIFHLSFSGASVLFTALGVSLLVGTVMGAIPSGGMLGELLILNIYGFPSSALLAIAAISIIIDLPATLLNVVGNSVSSMMIARLVEGKQWLTHPRSHQESTA
jgi:Na+/H+-dicarboxylate symporter